MKPIEIAERIRNKNPKLVENIDDAQAASIIRAALAQINNQLNKTDEGLFVVQGFGKFQVKQVEKQKDDKTVTMKRVIFKSAPKKAKVVENK